MNNDSDPRLEDADAGTTNPSPNGSGGHEPEATDKPATTSGTANQESRNTADTTTEAHPDLDAVEDAEAELKAAFVSDDTSSAKPAAPTENAEQSAESTAAEQDHKPGETQPDTATKPATDSTPTDAELEKLTRKEARARIKNLASEKQVIAERATKAEAEATKAKTAIERLETVAHEAGFTNAADLMRDLQQLGRAVHRGDTVARQELIKRLGIEAPSAPTLSAKQRELLERFDLVEEFNGAGQTETPSQKTPEAPTQQHQTQAQPPRQEQGRPASGDEAFAIVENLVEDLFTQHKDHAPEVLAKIQKEVERKERETLALNGRPIAPSAYRKVFSEARDRVLASASPATQQRTGTLRSTQTPAKQSPVDDMEADLKRQFVVG